MLSINTNLPSLTAQRSLSNSTKLLNQAIERMSTGFKINHASDNAANYSISTNMTTKIGAYEVAEDNVASGLDLLATAEGSLDLISDKLTRLRALAEQAANGTYGEQSLKAINSEANAIVDEIERLYNTTEYNGINLFGASDMPADTVDETSIIDVKKRDTSTMRAFGDGFVAGQAVAAGTYSISSMSQLRLLHDLTNQGLVSSDVEIVLANDINAGPDTFNNGWSGIGQGRNYFTGTFDGNGYEINNITIKDPGAVCVGLFGTLGGTVKNLGMSYATVEGDDYVGILAGMATADATIINSYVAGTVTASGSHVGRLIGEDQGADIDSRSKAFPIDESGNIPKISAPDEDLAEPDLHVDIDFQVGISGDDSSVISLNTACYLNVSFLRGIGKDNNNYLSKIDNLINKVSAKQTEYGAAQNRLESALEEITTQYDNLVSSRSTLRDADIAEVSSEYIRQQILQQASATLLATANQSPALALQLL